MLLTGHTHFDRAITNAMLDVRVTVRRLRECVPGLYTDQDSPNTDSPIEVQVCGIVKDYLKMHAVDLDHFKKSSRRSCRKLQGSALLHLHTTGSLRVGIRA